MKTILFCLLATFLWFPIESFGQNDLLDQLLTEDDTAPQNVTGTFKGTRIINGHAVETREKGVLDFIISHRFGRINGGAYQFFGLDQSSVRLGLEYGVLDRLNVGIGRSSFQKVFDGYIKYRLLTQKAPGGAMPVSVVWFSNIAINSLKIPGVERDFSDRLASTSQLLIARKFNENLSLQISPTYVRRNSPPLASELQNTFALGFGGRHKITPRTSINMEYFHRFDTPSNNIYHNSLSLGVDIETGGHVFQLHLTNSQAMTETMFIPETTGNFFGGDIHFGFNVSRTFQVRRH
ncbi:DUF5777 family beta-barrel protein [Belliella marina]|uniref:DUF5777 family beta-barrel protein n=1 Tax=Belliella marina TaxID=1644146 RepID=A0ABW4VQ40_9BACT